MTELATVTTLTPEEAERLTVRISLKLDSMADLQDAALPLIREAIAREAYKPLRYQSHGAYVAERFGDALARLGIDMRQAVVHELHDAGLSTRAIAPVVGVSHKTVVKDLQVVPEVPVEDVPAPTLDAPEQSLPPKAPKITGVNGKTYKRKAAEPKPKTNGTRRKKLPDQVEKAGVDLRVAMERLVKLSQDDRFDTNSKEMAPRLQSHLQYVIRTAQGLLDHINQQKG